MSERHDAPAAAAADETKPTSEANREIAKAEIKSAEIKSDTETKPDTPVVTAAGESRPAPKPEGKPGMPRAAQLSDAPRSDAPRIANLPVLHKPPVKEKQGRRFALLAAAVAIAACGGAIAGSLSSAGIERAFAPEPSAQAVVSVPQDQTAAEIKALKEQVAQLRVTARQLSESLAAARATMGQSSAATTGQLTKIAEAVERIEKNERKEAERRAQAPAPQQQAPAQDVTGSINPPAPAAAAKAVMPVVPGWTLRRVIDGGALVAGPLGLIEIEPGERVPGLGRIEAVRREDGRWVVVTQKGLILPR
jgi:hypothetical protein